MKRVALITLHTPTSTNFGGASALPYHLMKYRPNDVELEVWSFNTNGCDAVRISASEVELGVKIHLLNTPKWMRWLASKVVRFFLPRPYLDYLSISDKTVNEINQYLEINLKNGLWIYGEELAGLARCFPEYKTVVTTPDCEALYYLRMFGMQGVGTSWKWLVRYSLMYRRYCRHTAMMPTSENMIYHLVGKEDQTLFNNLNHKAKSVFIRHPHYDVVTREIVHNADDKLRILIAGRNNVYMAAAAKEAIDSLVKVGATLSRSFEISFLGQGWDVAARQLSDAGYEVKTIGYVDDYIAEIQRYDIQLTPISVGTGTKGKVLDAFANGLMVIGTPFALENIAVENGKSCIIYENGGELVAALEDISKQPDIVQSIAEAGRDAILTQHSRKEIACQVFSCFG